MFVIKHQYFLQLQTFIKPHLIRETVFSYSYQVWVQSWACSTSSFTNLSYEFSLLTSSASWCFADFSARLVGVRGVSCGVDTRAMARCGVVTPGEQTRALMDTSIALSHSTECTKWKTLTMKQKRLIWGTSNY